MQDYHECEGGIEKLILRINIWHHEACRVMTKGDPEGQIFLSHQYKNNGFYFLLTIKYCILSSNKRLPEVSEYPEVRHDMMMSI